MDKRTFIKLASTAALSIATGQSFLGCNTQAKEALSKTAGQKALPNNWLWLRPMLDKSDDDLKYIFEKIKNAGIDAILPQIYSSRETLFYHPTLPVKEAWLEKILPIAHAAGLQVHAWMWTMILNNPDYIEKHPDWYSVNRNGEPAHTHPAYVGYYKFLCPCNEEVADFVAGNVEALAKIEDLDGIHLDYVRQPDVILAEALQPKYDIIQDKEYPQYDYPYSENCRTQFKEKHGLDPFNLGDEAPQHEAWRQFRYDAVSNIVNKHCVPMARKYGKTITAAVFPNWESVRQEWHTWDLDAFLPMLYHKFYNADIPWVGEEVQKAKARLKAANNNKPVFSGLYLPHFENAAGIKEAITSAKNNGAQGIALFNYSNLKDEFWDVLRG